MFDTKSFMKQSFVARTEQVSLPALASWFPEGEEPLWEVRGLTATEVAYSNEAAVADKSIETLLKVISDNSVKVEEIRKAAGLPTDEVPGEVTRRLQQLVYGSVSPSITHDVAVKLAETFPIEFYTITRKIGELTGLGMDMGKSKPSGKTT